VLEPLVTLKSRDDGGGSGLGLAIVAKIAERWNGRVEVLSEDGVRGTVVRVVLSRPTVIELSAA
jgi:signal transduction histidine kinase